MIARAKACRRMDRSQRTPRGRTESAILVPAVAKARIVLQCCKIRIQLDEFAPYSLDHRAYIGAVAALTVASDKAIAANNVINLAIPYVAACSHRQQCDNVELVPAERDMTTTPNCAL